MAELFSGFADAMVRMWDVLGPHADHSNGFLAFVVSSLVNMARNYFWFVLIGMAIWAIFVRRRGASFSPINALRYLLPASFYTHRSVRIDAMMVPISWILNFTVFAALALGAAVVQMWLVQRFGHVPWVVSAGWMAVTLQVVFTLLGTDLGRFAWHYQGHFVPFFWEFHKGHHSAEVLHPVFIRTHPVDMFIRLAYMNVGGGLIGGGLMYLAGVDASATAASWVIVIRALSHLAEEFEHSHVVFSFGKTLDRIFYPPAFHRVHHSALLHHRDKNLGLTGGLCLWDKLCGTLYIPTRDEHIVYGSSLEELGDNNPHRTLRGFLCGPFVEAFRTLRPRRAAAALEVPAAQ